jgi:hypothetical protein
LGSATYTNEFGCSVNKKAEPRMAAMPEPSASRPTPSSGSRLVVLTIVVDGVIL